MSDFLDLSDGSPPADVPEPPDALEAMAAAFPDVVVFDLVALGLSVLLGVTVGLDTTITGRGPLALVFFLIVPGWALLRAWSVRPSSLSLLLGLGLSISVTFLGGQVLIAWGWWAWRIATVLICLACAAVFARDLKREWP